MTMHPSAGPLFAQIEPTPERRAIARSHKADPDTSHTAAKRHNTTGAARTNLAAVVRAVVEHPDCTSGELAELLPGLDLAEVRRRLVDAKRFRQAVVSGSRPCSVCGTRQSTWAPHPTPRTGVTLDVTA